MASYDWRLSAVLRRRRISVRELRDALDKEGICRSRSQLYRLCTQRSISFEEFAALCRALNCTPNDLLECQPVRAAAGQKPARLAPPRFRLP